MKNRSVVLIGANGFAHDALKLNDNPDGSIDLVTVNDAKASLLRGADYGIALERRTHVPHASDVIIAAQKAENEAAQKEGRDAAVIGQEPALHTHDTYAYVGQFSETTDDKGNRVVVSVSVTVPDAYKLPVAVEAADDQADGKKSASVAAGATGEGKPAVSTPAVQAPGVPASSTKSEGSSETPQGSGSGNADEGGADPTVAKTGDTQ